MPRLNRGTLLENIVVIESTRMCLDRSTTGQPLGFASAFAMPALTQCWCKASERKTRRFNHEYLRQLAAGQQEPQSLKELWCLCIRNEAKLPFWSFHDDRQQDPAVSPFEELVA